MVEYGYANVASGDPGITQNLLQINVYYKSLNVRTVREYPVYDEVICYGII